MGFLCVCVFSTVSGFGVCQFASNGDEGPETAQHRKDPEKGSCSRTFLSEGSGTSCFLGSDPFFVCSSVRLVRTIFGAPCASEAARREGWGRRRKGEAPRERERRRDRNTKIHTSLPR